VTGALTGILFQAVESLIKHLALPIVGGNHPFLGMHPTVFFEHGIHSPRTLVSPLRLSDDTLNPNLGAEQMTTVANLGAQAAKTALSNRAWKVSGKADVKTSSERMLADRIDRWVKEATRCGCHFGYETERGQGDVFALLKKPGQERWNELTAPMSMREVEPGVSFIMDDAKLDDGPAWQAAVATES